MNVLFVSQACRVFTEALERELATTGGHVVVTITPDNPGHPGAGGWADVILVAGGRPSGLVPAVSWLRRRFPDVPVVALLPELSSELVRRTIPLGVSGFLSAEDAVSDLLHALQQVSRGRIVLPAAGAAARHAGRDATDTEQDLSLTPRELDVLAQVAAGREDQEAARLLFISPLTLRTHVRNILRKMGVRSRMAAVLKAAEFGLIDLPDRSETAPALGAGAVSDRSDRTPDRRLARTEYRIRGV